MIHWKKKEIETRYYVAPKYLREQKNFKGVLVDDGVLVNEHDKFDVNIYKSISIWSEKENRFLSIDGKYQIEKQLRGRDSVYNIKKGNKYLVTTNKYGFLSSKPEWRMYLSEAKLLADYFLSDRYEEDNITNYTWSKIDEYYTGRKITE